MKMKLFIVNLCCIWTIEMQASSQSHMGLFQAPENIIQHVRVIPRESAHTAHTNFVSESLAGTGSELHDSKSDLLADLERRVSLLAARLYSSNGAANSCWGNRNNGCCSFAIRNQEAKFRTGLCRMGSRLLQIEKIKSQVDLIKSDIEAFLNKITETVSRLQPQIDASVEHITNIEGSLGIVETSIGDLRNSMNQLTRRVHVIEESVTSGSLATNSLFLKEIELILVRLLAEKYCKTHEVHKVQATHDYLDDGPSSPRSPPSGRASTSSKHSQAVESLDDCDDSY